MMGHEGRGVFVNPGNRQEATIQDRPVEERLVEASLNGPFHLVAVGPFDEYRCCAPQRLMPTATITPLPIVSPTPAPIPIMIPLPINWDQNANGDRVINPRSWIIGLYLWYYGAGVVRKRCRSLDTTRRLYRLSTIKDGAIGICQTPQIHEQGISGNVFRICHEGTFGTHCPGGGPCLFSRRSYERCQPVRKWHLYFYLILCIRIACCDLSTTQNDENAHKDKMDMPTIAARVKRLSVEEIPKKVPDPQELIIDKNQILDRVQQRHEGYNFITKTLQVHYLLFNILAVSNERRSSLCRNSS
jgi:hypothetical protein